MSARNPTGKVDQQSQSLADEENADALGGRYAKGTRGAIDEEAAEELRSGKILSHDPTQTRHNVKLPNDYYGMVINIYAYMIITGASGRVGQGAERDRTGDAFQRQFNAGQQK